MFFIDRKFKAGYNNFAQTKLIATFKIELDLSLNIPKGCDSHMANDTNQNTVINAYPTKELFIEMLTKDITLRDAIGDLLDNSVDGALRLREDNSYEGLWVKIELNAKEGHFKIIDNCGGITAEVARDYAFRFGRPAGVEGTPHSVGLFGIGMKRALFKLGNQFEVESVASTSSFTMKVDVEQWKNNKETNWTFEFDEVKENENNPENKCGTTITVTKLREDVQESFGLENEVSELIEDLEREHTYNIIKGLKIHVAGNPLVEKDFEFLTSDKIKTAYWKDSKSPLSVEMYAGISKETDDADSAGWHIFCNDRLVVGPESRLGWGVKGTPNIPERHSQYYMFRGYALLKAENPKDLPWNTAKNGMEEDSMSYKRIFQKIVVLMRSVIDFLNQLHEEKGDFDNERISETPLQDALQQVEPLRLLDITPEDVGQTFISPDPAKPQQPVPSVKWIRYSADVDRYNAAKKYLGVENPGEVGSKTFEYFYSREIED